MAYDDDFEVAKRTADNLIVQLTADRERRPSYSDQEWYEGMLAHYNALVSEGVFEASFNPEDIFSAVSQRLQVFGLASLENMLMAQEALGAWDSYPLVWEEGP